MASCARARNLHSYLLGEAICHVKKERREIKRNNKQKCNQTGKF